MGTTRRRFLALATIALGAPFASGHAFAQAAKPQASDTNIDGVTAEISEASRKEGVLTVKMRLRNTGSANAKVQISGDWRDVDKWYAVAGSTKFLPLKDSQKMPLMVQLDNYGALSLDIKPGGSFLFWAKYPAPPQDARKFTFYTPLAPPIEDVPISDAK
ncbi:MAG: hypothetical protein ACXWF2_15110 [Usitatibacter sp.]